MKSAVVVDCLRTPVGRSHKDKGYFRQVRSDDLAVHVVEALLDRSGIDPGHVEDIVMGNTQQHREQGFDVARCVGLMSGLPAETGGVTVNRLCGSSLQALNQTTHAIMAGFEDVHVVGGLEHMHHLPMDTGYDPNPKLFRHTSQAAMNMGFTAEFLAQSRGISREAQDKFALSSHHKAAGAQRNGAFANEIIPTWGHDEQQRRVLIDSDQCVRPDTSAEALAELKPAFMPNMGTVTAGNSSPLNDGAAAMLVMSEEKARSLGLTPLVRVVATAVVGVDPCVMGTGPVPATRKALQRAGMSLSDVDLVELNEAFAAQALACLQDLEIDQEKLNVHGGAIAIGHPLGASGARIACTLIHAMLERDANVGLATMCIGIGQGIATIFERV